SQNPFWDFLASLRLTVWLLSLSMVLIFLGTLEQVHWGVWHVQKEYFSSWFCFYPLDPQANFSVPLPAGFLLGALLLINLTCAHFRHYKPGLKNLGISTIHGGLLLLLVGGFITAIYQEESAMVIPEGESRNYSEAFRDFEIAVVEKTNDGKDKVVAIPDALLTEAKEIMTLGTSGLKLKVQRYFPNSALRGQSQITDGIPVKVSRGLGAESPIALKPLAQSYNDSTESFAAQTFVCGDRSFEISLRRLRTYLPFALQLNLFTHEKYPGTEIPKRFASDVTILSDATKVPFHISMNQPLRHGGMTFYQSSYGVTSSGKNLSVLQTVRNPGWLIPYLSVGLMSFGLVWHFGVSLFHFLNRQKKATLASLILLGCFIPQSYSAESASAQTWDTEELGNLPIQSGGRIIPLETLANSSLLLMRARREIALSETEVIAFGKKPSTWTKEEAQKITEELPNLNDTAKDALEKRSVRIQGNKIKAIDWMIEVCFRGHVARHLPTFRIDHPVVLKYVGKDSEKTKFASWFDVLKNIEAISKAAERSRQIPQANRDAEDRAILQLEAAAKQYALLSMTFIPGDLPPQIPPQKEYDAWIFSLSAAAEQMRKNGRTAEGAPKFDQELQENLKLLIERYREFAADGSIRIVPGVSNDRLAPWDNLGNAVLSVVSEPGKHRDALSADGTLTRYATFCQAWREGDDQTCAQVIGALYRAHTGTWTDRTDGEATFSRLQPFYWLLMVYLLAFLLVLWTWATGNDAPRSWAFALLISVFLLHTLALGYRMWLHERPPVTNLYSSGIFIAWGAVLLGIILEKIWKNGIGAAAAGISGFLSLIVAHNLGLSGEDNLESVRAVLDSNFWLSTHVTTVTLGYSAMFVAGLVGAIHLWLRAFKSDYQEGEAVARAAYGILAFALIMSFIGTMLGGIWADQSWGRFWGW
ncbi:MAG: hypothetical protein EBS00_05765, partial [Verrucomicrobia bacterium]|nr:hypothetical protein [Verrucomicrobiota bacterium]